MGVVWSRDAISNLMPRHVHGAALRLQLVCDAKAHAAQTPTSSSSSCFRVVEQSVSVVVVVVVVSTAGRRRLVQCRVDAAQILLLRLTASAL